MRATKPAWGTTRESVKKKMARAAVKSIGYKIQTKMLCMLAVVSISQSGCKSLFLAVIVDNPPGTQDTKAYGEKKSRDVGFLRSSPFSRFPAFWWDLVITPVQVLLSM